MNIGVEKYGLSAFKCRVARMFPSPGCKGPSYRMKKFLTYIWEYNFTNKICCNAKKTYKLFFVPFENHGIGL